MAFRGVRVSPSTLTLPPRKDRGARKLLQAPGKDEAVAAPGGLLGNTPVYLDEQAPKCVVLGAGALR